MANLLLVGCWLGLTAFGLVKAARYDSMPVTIPVVKSEFPKSDLIHLASETPTVVLFVHPACPCTKATVHALEESQARALKKAHIYVVFAQPFGLPRSAESLNLEAMAKRIDSAEIVKDPNCEEAKRFGATVSGQCFVFFPDGSLQFSGGLTRARGHYGGSEGSEALLSILDGMTTDVKRAPVFGCSLQ